MFPSRLRPSNPFTPFVFFTLPLRRVFRHRCPRFLQCLLPQLQRRRRCLKVDYLSSGPEENDFCNVLAGWKTFRETRAHRRGRDYPRGGADSVPDVEDVISKETGKRSRREKGRDYARSLRAILLALTRCSAKGKGNGSRSRDYNVVLVGTV